MSGNIIETGTKVATTGGATIGVLGSLSSADLLALIGVITAVVSAIIGGSVNFWYKRSLIKIARERLEYEKDELAHRHGES